MSQRLVTGDDLKDILSATRKYIDSDFEEVLPSDLDLDGVPTLSLTGMPVISDEQIQGIINKYFIQDTEARIAALQNSIVSLDADMKVLEDSLLIIDDVQIYSIMSVSSDEEVLSEQISLLEQRIAEIERRSVFINDELIFESNDNSNANDTLGNLLARARILRHKLVLLERHNVVIK